MGDYQIKTGLVISYNKDDQSPSLDRHSAYSHTAVYTGRFRTTTTILCVACLSSFVELWSPQKQSLFRGSTFRLFLFLRPLHLSSKMTPGNDKA